MTRKEKKQKAPHGKDGGKGLLSRREFTLGSMAVIGSSPLALADVSQEPPPFKLDISKEVRRIMVDRRILEDDLVKVIDHAEKNGVKLYRQDGDLLLAKLRMDEVYFYAEYSPVEGGYRIHNTYSHRFLLEEGV
jgi:hypothetical protein